MAQMNYPYSTTDPHVHDFTERNEHNQLVCGLCGVPGAGNSGSGRRGKVGSTYVDYGVPRLPGERTKW